jgi:hypothetical protein
MRAAVGFSIHIRWAAAILLSGAALAACIYNFDNAVVMQSSGTVSGELVVGQAAAGESLDGAKIDLLWSNLSITLGATSGHFNFLDLPAGTYRIRITVPPPAGASNDFPIEVSQGQIYLPQTPEGQPDTLAMGPIQVDLAGVVGGTIAGLGDGGAVVGSFEPDPDGGGVGEFEGYATTTGADGTFSLTLPAGTHQLWASTATASGSLVTLVQAGASVMGQQLPLAAPAGGPSADLVGYAVVGNYGAAAPVSQLQSILQDGGLAISLSPAGGVPPPTLSFETPAPAEGVTGLRVDQQLVPGTMYQVSVGPPASIGTAQLVPAVLTNVPAIAGRATFLQQIFLFSVATIDANKPDAGPSGGALLVDNDQQGGASVSAPLFKQWLNGVPLTYTTYEQPATDPNDVDATNPSLAGIDTVAFFTGGLITGTLSAAQQTTLQTWLNAGGHTLILFSAGLVDNIGVGGWTATETNAFLTQILGAQGDEYDPSVWSSEGGDRPIDNATNTVVTGGANVPAFAGKQWTTLTGSSTVPYLFSVIDPTSSVDVLATVSADPTNGDIDDLSAAVALGRKGIGTARTSTVVWVGFTVENIEPTGSPNTLPEFFTAVQNYAGL